MLHVTVYLPQKKQYSHNIRTIVQNIKLKNN